MQPAETTIPRHNMLSFDARVPQKKNGHALSARGITSREGFTLLEVTIAMVVVTLASAGLLSALSTGYAIDRETSDSLAAQNMGRRVMEELLERPFETLLSYDNTYIQENGMRSDLTVQREGDAEGNPSMVKIQVTVRRTGQNTVLARFVTLHADRTAPHSAWHGSF